MLILSICLWLLWWLGGLWLTIRVITKRRDFHRYELIPMAIICAIAGPFVAAVAYWASSEALLFSKRK